MHSFELFLQKTMNIQSRFKPDMGVTNEILKIITQTFKEPPKIPTVIDNSKIIDNNTENLQNQISPINKQPVCYYNMTKEVDLRNYLKQYNYFKQSMARMTIRDRNYIFKKAANLLKHKYREQMMAYTIMGQGKSLYEAEIDSVCELGDFLNFNAEYCSEIINRQPLDSHGTLNESVYNPLNGFVAAITPFNFTAIGGNLASAPTLFGNSVIWKPSNNAVLSNYLFFEIMREAGLPEEAIAFTPCDPELFRKVIIESPELGGLLFTGSSDVFTSLTKQIYGNIENYNSFPKLIGETGGKNFHFVHPRIEDISMNFIAKKAVESAYGYSGQKCSACSIIYIPEHHEKAFLEEFEKERTEFIKSPAFNNYGLIHCNSYDKTEKVLLEIKNNDSIDIIHGGNYSKKDNYYIEPTLVKCQDHSQSVFTDEYFAPILTMYTYNEKDLYETMYLCKHTNKYALTGSVFSSNYRFIDYSKEYFRDKCGNFYINDKSTGSIVGQQPFGGSGKSGTNDKAGDINLLYRLFNQQNIKTNTM